METDLFCLEPLKGRREHDIIKNKGEEKSFFFESEAMILKIEHNVLLKSYTTLGIGGPADTIVHPETIEEIRDLIRENSIEQLYILGNGVERVVRRRRIRRENRAHWRAAETRSNGWKMDWSRWKAEPPTRSWRRFVRNTACRGTSSPAGSREP